MKKKLCDIAEIRPGHPFRGSISPADEDGTPVIQVRDIDSYGHINANKLVKTELTGKKQPDFIKQGDILFVAKGAKHFATCIQNKLSNTVSSPHFFIIRVLPEYKDEVLPEFISWQINQIPAQRYFQATAEGSLYVSIRRQVLEDTQLKLPSLEKQKLLVRLHSTAMNEQKALEDLIENRKKQLEAIARIELS